MNKHIKRFLFGGTVYIIAEIIWRAIVNHRSTNIVVFFLAGLVCVTTLLCEDKRLNIFLSSLIGTVVTTLGELIIGIISVDIFNTYLWCYGGITYRGIICLHWSLLWYGLCFGLIICYRFLRRKLKK